jgi:hypothetical protein
VFLLGNIEFRAHTADDQCKGLISGIGEFQGNPKRFADITAVDLVELPNLERLSLQLKDQEAQKTQPKNSSHKGLSRRILQNLRFLLIRHSEFSDFLRTGAIIFAESRWKPPDFWEGI